MNNTAFMTAKATIKPAETFHVETVSGKFLNIRANSFEQAMKRAKGHFSPEAQICAAHKGEKPGEPCAYRPFYGKAPSCNG